jgi:hypothetical protein
VTANSGARPAEMVIMPKGAIPDFPKLLKEPAKAMAYKRVRCPGAEAHDST